MDALSRPGLKIGIWAASLHDDQGKCLCPGREEEAFGLARAFLKSHPGDEAVLALDRPRRAERRLTVLEVVTRRKPASRPTVLNRLVSAALAVKRRASALRARVAGSRLRMALLLLLLLPFLPLLVPACLAWRLARLCRPGLGEALARLADPAGPLVCPEQMLAAKCDAWLVLSSCTSFPFPAGVRIVWLLDDQPVEGVAERAIRSLVAGPSLNGALFAVVDPKTLAHPSLARFWQLAWRYRVVPALEADWDAPAAALRSALAEAAALPATAPTGPARSARSRPRIHLFLPACYQGGVWEATRTLVEGLAEVRRERAQADFTVALVPGQDLDSLKRAIPDFRFEWITTQSYPGGCFPWSPSALEADAWFSLVDRFFAPVVPPVPFGVAVYDVIQRFAPELFPKEFIRDWLPAMRATVTRASLILTTNPVTARDAALEYGMPLDRVALVPVACEPATRFASLSPEPAAPDAPDGFVLNITNIAPHKGLACVLRAYASLKARCGDRGPGLVVAGVQTDQASPSHGGEAEPHAARLQALSRELGLLPGRDVWYLGFCSDAQLMGLYQRCSAVVNAARHDNGTFSLIEAHWFGKFALCSRYAAAESLYQRFGIPVRYFDPDGHEALAELMREAMGRPRPSDAHVARCRASLAQPDLGHRRYAERVHDLLLALARSGASARAA